MNHVGRNQIILMREGVDSHMMINKASQSILPSSNGVAMKPGLKRRRYHHSRIIKLSVVFVGSSTASALSFTQKSKQEKNMPPIGKEDFAFTTRHWRSSISNPRSIRRKIIPLSASLSSSEFPSQDYSEDSNVVWDDETNTQRKNVFRRLGGIPHSRREIFKTGNNDGMLQSDDEWESYLNMDVIIDDVGDRINVPDSEGEINGTLPRQLLMESSKVDGEGLGANHSSSTTEDSRKSGVSIPAAKGETMYAIHSNTIRNKLNPDGSPRSQQQQQPRTPRRRMTTDQINIIKSSISLVDVIESYNLPHFTRSSNSYSQSTATAKACCPFHDDHNPSMSIDNSRGLYKCFVCDAGGDVFNFVREYDYLEKAKRGQEKMAYIQAVEYVAREFGNTDLVRDWNFGIGSRDGTVEGMSDEAKENIRQREWKKERLVSIGMVITPRYTLFYQVFISLLILLAEYGRQIPPLLHFIPNV